MRGPLQLDKKLGNRRGQINALGGLIFLKDSKSGKDFLVDTGAAVIGLPHASNDRPSGQPRG